jgi:hypothetical protein
MRIVIASLLAFVLAAAPLYAQQPGFSISRAAQAEAAKQGQASARARVPMSPAYKWTGIGLLLGGGLTLATAVLVDDACIENGEYSQDFCDDFQTAWIAGGATIAGAGAAMLLIGNAKRGPAPSLTIGARRVAWRFRF